MVCAKVTKYEYVRSSQQRFKGGLVSTLEGFRWGYMYIEHE